MSPKAIAPGLRAIESLNLALRDDGQIPPPGRPGLADAGQPQRASHWFSRRADGTSERPRRALTSEASRRALRTSALLRPGRRAVDEQNHFKLLEVLQHVEQSVLHDGTGRSLIATRAPDPHVNSDVFVLR